MENQENRFAKTSSKATIKSLNETTHRYCRQEQLQFRPKLASSTCTGNSFNICVKE